MKMAGVAGFEPAHADTKNRCLTAWLHPNITMRQQYNVFINNTHIYISIIPIKTAAFNRCNNGFCFRVENLYQIFRAKQDIF